VSIQERDQLISALLQKLEEQEAQNRETKEAFKIVKPIPVQSRVTMGWSNK
jgi:hypothetical protein